MKLKVLSQYLIIFATVVIFISSVQAGEISDSVRSFGKVYVDEEIKPAILKLIYEADERIDIQMYILTDQDIIRALERAEDRGVEVRIILDPNQRYNLKHVYRLKREGIEVKWYPVNKPALMHRKMAIFDKEKVFLGSANWSRNGLTNNKEINVLIDDAKIADEVTEIFSDGWYYSFLGHYDKY